MALVLRPFQETIAEQTTATTARTGIQLGASIGIPFAEHAVANNGIFTKTSGDYDVDIFLDGNVNRRINVPIGSAGARLKPEDGEFRSIVVLNNGGSNQLWKLVVWRT